MSEWRSIGLKLTTALWLAAAWILLWGDLRPGTVVAAVLVSAAVMLVFPLPRRPVLGQLNFFSAVRLCFYVFGQVVVSSFHVAWLAIRPGPRPESALLVAPMRLQTDFVLALAVNTLNIIPGGIVVRIDERNRQVIMHVLEAGNQRQIEKFYAGIEAIEWRYVRAFEPPENLVELEKARRSTRRAPAMRDVWVIDDETQAGSEEVR